MSLGFDCTDGGSHVLALSRGRSSRSTPATRTEIVCVDPGRVAVRLRLLAARSAARAVQRARPGVPGGQRRAGESDADRAAGASIRETCTTASTTTATAPPTAPIASASRRRTAGSSPAAPSRRRGCCRSTARRARWSCRRRWRATIRCDVVRERARRTGRRHRLPGPGDRPTWRCSGRRSATTTSRCTTTRAWLLACEAGTPRGCVVVRRDGDRHARVLGAAARPLPPGRGRRPAGPRRRRGAAALGRRVRDAVARCGREVGRRVRDAVAAAPVTSLAAAS